MPLKNYEYLRLLYETLSDNMSRRVHRYSQKRNKHQILRGYKNLKKKVIYFFETLLKKLSC